MKKDLVKSISMFIIAALLVLLALVFMASCGNTTAQTEKPATTVETEETDSKPEFIHEIEAQYGSKYEDLPELRYYDYQNEGEFVAAHRAFWDYNYLHDWDGSLRRDGDNIVSIDDRTGRIWLNCELLGYGSTPWTIRVYDEDENGVSFWYTSNGDRNTRKDFWLECNGACSLEHYSYGEKIGTYSYRDLVSDKYDRTYFSWFEAAPEDEIAEKGGTDFFMAFSYLKDAQNSHNSLMVMVFDRMSGQFTVIGEQLGGFDTEYAYVNDGWHCLLYYWQYGAYEDEHWPVQTYYVDLTAHDFSPQYYGDHLPDGVLEFEPAPKFLPLSDEYVKKNMKVWEAFNSGDWDGSFKELEEGFWARIDEEGRIFVNNEETGHICLLDQKPYAVVVKYATAENPDDFYCMMYEDDGELVVRKTDGEEIRCELPEGSSHIVDAVFAHDGSLEAVDRNSTNRMFAALVATNQDDESDSLNVVYGDLDLARFSETYDGPRQNYYIKSVTGSIEGVKLWPTLPRGFIAFSGELEGVRHDFTLDEWAGQTRLSVIDYDGSMSRDDFDETAVEG